MLLIALLSAWAMATPSLAQPKPEPVPSEWKEFAPPGMEVFELNHISPNEFLELLNTFGIKFDRDKRGYFRNRLFLTFTDPATAERARHLLKKIDIPPRRIVLHFQLVLASDKPPSGQQKPLTDVVLRDQLKQVFKFNSYQLLDRAYLTLNSEEGGSASLAGGYRVSCKPTFIDEGKGVIKLRELTLSDVGGPIPAPVVRMPEFKPGDLEKLKELMRENRKQMADTLKQMEEAQKKAFAYLEIQQEKIQESQKRFEEAWKKLEESQKKAFAFDTRKGARRDNRLLTTSLNIKNGDTVIVGSSTIDGEDSALITVVTATVLN
jgi:hypothetical protein